MIKNVSTRMAAALAAALLSACSHLDRTNSKIDDAAKAASAVSELARQNATSGAGVRTARPRFAGEEVSLRTNSRPALFNQQDCYSTKGSQSLMQVIEDIAQTRGIAIKTSEVAQTGQQSGGFMQGGIQQGNAVMVGNISIQYCGTIGGLLDAIGSKADITFRWNEQTKQGEFFRYETRTIPVLLPAGEKTIAAAISLNGVSGGGGSSGGGSGGGGGGGGAASSGNVSVSQNLTVNPWKSLMDGIGTMLNIGGSTHGGSGGGMPMPAPAGAGGANGGSSGGALSSSGSSGFAIATPELGIVSVTARPVTLERVARYIESFNARYAQNVLIDLKIYSVNITDDSSLGINASMLYQSIGKLGGSITGPAPLQPGSGSPGILTVTAQNANSNWNGSTLVAQALQQFGKVSLVRQGQALAINGQPSPIQVANEISYPSSSTINTVPNSGVTKTKTQDRKVIGLTGNFLPLILGDNRILLSYQLQLSTLASPLVPDSDGIVSPNIASQSLQQQVFVKDGQSIVLFGYDEQRDSINSATHLAGTSRAASGGRTMVVIVMQVNTGAKDGSI